MNLIELSKKFNTHKKCVAHLEKVRWAGKYLLCPIKKCSSPSIIKRQNTADRSYKTTTYHCNDCNKDFTVLKGTIFEKSQLSLPKWFMIIALMLNAKKGISAMQLSRDVGIPYKTAWYSSMRVRCAMLDQANMLEGILEMDEAYIGGKPRHRNKPDQPNAAYLSKLSTKRGRGTNQVPIVGIVEREGKKRVVAKVQDGLTGKDMLAMLKRYVKMDRAILITDEYRGYNIVDKYMQHLKVNHSKKEYVRDGIIHTNTIEGFWTIIKNGIRGQYHVLSKKYLPFYLAEFSYKYNRKSQNRTVMFDEALDNAVSDEKCTVNNKPKKHPKFLAYRLKKKKAQNG